MPRKLNRQQKYKRNYERAVFKGFLETRRQFAGRPVRYWFWNRNDPPDIFCWTTDRRKIGVELVSWVDENQIGYAKRIERSEKLLLQRIGATSSIRCQHIRFAILRPRPDARPKGSSANISKIFNTTLKQVDAQWPELESNNKVDLRDSDLPGELIECVKGIVFLGTREKRLPERVRIEVPMKGGPYTPQTMLDALRKNIQKKCSLYSRSQFPPDGCYLLIHYDEASFYCSPIVSPFDTVESHAKAAAKWLKADHGPFDHAFLYVGPEPGREVFDLM